MFVDYIVNLHNSYVSARIITCLHHPKSGLGEPSVLPIVDCEEFPLYSKSSSVVLISTKQPVPRCPAQQALAILIELQLAQKEHAQSTDAKLRSCAWTKIPLFDSKGRLLSGRWKVQLKNIPIKSDTALINMCEMPDVRFSFFFFQSKIVSQTKLFLFFVVVVVVVLFKFGYVELYYRLVNLRDSEEQTNAPISPLYSDQYNRTVQV